MAMLRIPGFRSETPRGAVGPVLLLYYGGEVIPVEHLQKLMEDAEMFADVKAYDAAKARLEDGEDELIPLEITERRLRGEAVLRIWREYRELTQEQLAKKSKVSRALIAAIETKRKAGSVSTWKKLGAALDVSWEQLT
jgi:mRNA interferase RelE/StbE